jgi:DnaK suppressor protein
MSVAIGVSKSDLRKLRSALESKHAELTKPVSRDAIAVEKMAEEMDEAQRAATRELAIHSLNHGSAILRSVRVALERLSGGSYGTCLHCEDDISLKRLEAVPWAAYCVKCQALADQSRLPTQAQTEKPS